MDQLIFSQYEHRVGQVLSANAFCDGCYRRFNDGEMLLRCLECSGFVCPDSNERNVRQIAITTNIRLQSGANQLNLSQTEPYSGYDLCLDCAKKQFLHNHHRFTLAISRK